MVDVAGFGRGARATVMKIDGDVLWVRVEDTLLPLPRMEFEAELDGLEVRRLQFPVRPWAITTCDAIQGATLNRIVVAEAPKGHGRAFVVASRVRTRASLQRLSTLMQLEVEQNHDLLWNGPAR